MRARAARQRTQDMEGPKPKLVVGGSRGRTGYGQAPDSVYADQAPYDLSPAMSPKMRSHSPLTGMEQRHMGVQQSGLQTPEGAFMLDDS